MYVELEFSKDIFRLQGPPMQNLHIPVSKFFGTRNVSPLDDSYIFLHNHVYRFYHQIQCSMRYSRKTGVPMRIPEEDRLSYQYSYSYWVSLFRAATPPSFALRILSTTVHPRRVVADARVREITGGQDGERVIPMSTLRRVHLFDVMARYELAGRAKEGGV